MAVGEEEVHAAVEVRVEEEDAEGQIEEGRRAHAASRRLVEKDVARVRPVEGLELVGEIADRQGEAPAVLRIGPRRAHGAARAPGLVHGDARRNRRRPRTCRRPGCGRGCSVPCRWRRAGRRGRRRRSPTARPRGPSGSPLPVPVGVRDVDEAAACRRCGRGGTRLPDSARVCNRTWSARRACRRGPCRGSSRRTGRRRGRAGRRRRSRATPTRCPSPNRALRPSRRPPRIARRGCGTGSCGSAR